MLDILAESQGFTNFDAIASMQAKKTGALFCFACEAGAILAKADATPLRQYAEHIGIALQIADAPPSMVAHNNYYATALSTV